MGDQRWRLVYKTSNLTKAEHRCKDNYETSVSPYEPPEHEYIIYDTGKKNKFYIDNNHKHICIDETALCSFIFLFCACFSFYFVSYFNFIFGPILVSDTIQK